MIDFIREFKFGRPQQIAALLLVAFIALSLSSALKPHHHSTEVHSELRAGPSPPITNGIIITRLGTLITVGLRRVGISDNYRMIDYLIPLLNTAMLGFGLSLAGALWWVTRRLYDDEGGYVALALFCFSLPMIFYSSRVSADIVAAWGLYGLIYTAIGVAHTLHAPPRKWRPRILLLGVALGVTAGAYFAAALVGLILAIGFMLYLAPGRRKESLLIIAIAGVIAAVFVLALYGFDLRAFGEAVTTKEAWSVRFGRGDFAILGPQWPLLGIVTGITLISYAVWKRARYFGNTVPLVVITVLFLLQHDGAQTAIWALPFVFTFIGGIFADLLETRYRKVVAWPLGAAMACYAGLGIAAVLFIPK